MSHELFCSLFELELGVSLPVYIYVETVPLYRHENGLFRRGWAPQRQ